MFLFQFSEGARYAFRRGRQIIRDVGSPNRQSQSLAFFVVARSILGELDEQRGKTANNILLAKPHDLILLFSQGIQCLSQKLRLDLRLA